MTDNIEVSPEAKGFENVPWKRLAQRKIQWWAFVYTIINLRTSVKPVVH